MLFLLQAYLAIAQENKSNKEFEECNQLLLQRLAKCTDEPIVCNRNYAEQYEHCPGQVSFLRSPSHRLTNK